MKALLLTLTLTLTLSFPIFANDNSKSNKVEIEKIFIVIFENTDFSMAIKDPIFKDFADQGVLFNNFYAETHPSQGNYIALTSGSTFNIQSDKNVDLDVTHIADLLEAKGKTWKVYADGYPGNCFLYNSGVYVRKHIPFLSYINIQNDKKRCSNIVHSMELEKDIKQGNLSDFSIYVPDLKNDGHDTGISYASRWFDDYFKSKLNNPNFITKMLFITTFDESRSKTKNQIYTSFYGEMLKPGLVVTQKHDHYSLLKLIEDVYSLGNLGRNDETAQPIEGIWR